MMLPITKTKKLHWLLLLSIAFLPISTLMAQLSISPQNTCATTGISYTYQTNPMTYTGTMKWDLTGGVITGGSQTSVTGTPIPQINVTWNTGATTGTVTLTYNSGTPTTLTVNLVAPLQGGAISSNKSQSINYNTTPAAINCSAASGGYCTPSYSYQWQSSTDAVNYTNMSGKTTQNLSFSSALTQTTYYRRLVTETNTSNTAYSDVATVIVYPVLSAGSISPSSKTINYNTSPGQITTSGTTGGSGTYTYQWQSSPNNSTWTNITGATTQNYTPGNLTATTYFRNAVTSNGVTAYTNSATITVYPQLVSGTITPSSVTVNYNTVPGTLTAGAATGGSGTYTYQWQSSPNNSTWADISGATALTYSPPALTATTYYHIVSTSNGASVNSSAITVTVYPQLTTSIAPASLTINYNASPGQLTNTRTGGSGTYTYQWQSSPDNSAWTSISGATSQNYTPPSLTAKTYYHVITTSNGVSVTSNTSTISVYPQIISSITVASTTIDNGTSPGQLTNTVSGGTGTYSYQWESSPDNNNWTDILGATAKNYTPGTLTANIYYRVNVVSNGSGVYSNILAITVVAPLVPGSLPASFNLSYAGSASIYDFSYSGGDGTYTFQWQSSPNNSTWTNITGATANIYSVSGQTSMYYRLQVTSSDLVGYTNAAHAILPLYGGIIGSTNTTVASGGSATLNSIQGASNDVCSTYGYQWQSSPDEIKWTNISSTSITGITATTYYRRLASCGSDTASSNIMRIKIATTAGTIKPNTATSPTAGTQTVIAMPSDYSGVDPNNVNYIRTRDFTRPGVTDTTAANAETDVTDVRQVTGYYDGLGRPVETVAKQATPGLHDLVSTNFYDAFGRETQAYLPYTDNGNSGSFRTDPDSKQPAFYNTLLNNTESYYYSNVQYEASPLNRVLETDAPGKSWTGHDVGVTVRERTNNLFDSVIIWSIGFGNDTLPLKTAYYNPGTLVVKETTDEHSNETVEYQDLEGHVVLKKVELSDSINAGHIGWLCTYYVYDDLGNLRTVIPPQAVSKLQGRSWAFESTRLSGSSIAKELCFHYQYNERRNMITKVVPGAGEVWMVYDARDRLVMTQDSAMRTQNNWLCTDYDSLNRPVTTGIWNTTGDRAYHENIADTSVTYPYPSSGYTLLTQTYYDDYSWVSGSGSGLSSSLITKYNTNTAYFYTADNTTAPYPQAITSTSQLFGTVTGTKINVVGTSTYLYSVNFYDDRLRLIESQATNYSGGIDTVVNQYSFSGQELRNLYCHGKAGTNPQGYTVLTKTFYDPAGRITAITKKISNSLEDTIASNSYDELGRLSLKKDGLVRNSLSDYTYSAQPLDTLRYLYNIRGWLCGINKDYARAQNSAVNWFGEDLSYDFGFTASQLNGNIAGIRWRNGSDNQQRAYGFAYDIVNRLGKADFTQNAGGSTWDVSAGLDYSVHSIGYDLNGNITAMNQMGSKLSSSLLIDSLIYSYNATSNKLNYVTDNVNDTSAHLGDFTEINHNTTQDYTYDGNGNLTKDNNKNIASVTYNYLNLPNVITVTNKGTITYTYDAAGNKIKKVTTEGSKTTTTLYLGAFNYINDTLQYIMHEEGRARPASFKDVDTFYYDFFEKDHLGNVRVVLTDQKQQDLYPAATLEHNTNAFNTEQSYYAINTADTVNVAGIASWANTTGKNYPNNNGNPPYNNNPYDSTSATSAVVYKLNGATGDKTGLGVTLKVMAGDVVDIYAKSFWHSNGTNPSNNNLITSALSTFISAFAGTPAVLGSSKGATASALNGSTATTNGLNTWLNGVPNPTQTSVPKAYLNWILFDEQFRPVSSGSGYDLVNTTSDAVKSHHKTVSIGNSGYLYVYCSNESNIDVFFDNLQVIHTRGPLLETTDYYPFGLTMAGISSQSLSFGKPENKRGFNGKEMQDKEFSDGSGLEEYDYGARMYDVQVGRWQTVDAKAELYCRVSPFAYSIDNPINYYDRDGNIVRDKNGNIVFIPIETITVHHGGDKTGKGARMIIGYILANDGTPVLALKNISGKKAWDTDCHGQTFTKGQYWINNDEVRKLLKGDGYKKIEEKDTKKGDIVVYTDEDKNVEDSRTITRTNVPKDKICVYGQGGLEEDNYETGINEAWDSEIREFYRKIQKDKQVDDNTQQIIDVLTKIIKDQREKDKQEEKKKEEKKP